MGDRAVIVLHAGDDIAPALYLHWGGSTVSALLQAGCNVMRGRPGDVTYAAARLCAEACRMAPGNLSVGLHGAPASLDEARAPDYSHGDAGVFIVDVSAEAWKATAHDGYGFNPDDERPDMAREYVPATSARV